MQPKQCHGFILLSKKFKSHRPLLLSENLRAKDWLKIVKTSISFFNAVSQFKVFCCCYDINKRNRNCDFRISNSWVILCLSLI